ncbi:hypothetical protein GCM10022398_14840 [Acetobacter lovaniensis]
MLFSFRRDGLQVNPGRGRKKGAGMQKIPSFTNSGFDTTRNTVALGIALTVWFESCPSTPVLFGVRSCSGALAPISAQD